MDINLVKLEMSGIKSIKDVIQLEFVSSGVNNKTISTYQSNVKAIFGENGAGKSAIINAIDLYKNLVSHYAYLSTDISARAVADLINKITKEFYIKMYFSALDGTKTLLYGHTIRVQLRNDNQPVVVYEKIELFKKLSVNADSSTLIEFDNGNVISSPQDDSDDTLLIINNMKSAFGVASGISFFNNPIMSNNFIEYLNDRIKNSNADTELSSLTSAAIQIALLADNMAVYLDANDKHIKFYPHEIKKIFAKTLDGNEDDNKNAISINDIVIPKQDYVAYVSQVERLTKFIKIFKDDLQEIRVNKKSDGEYYHVSKEYCYTNYSVEYEFESTGIKKLTQLFDYLDLASCGKIVFIDEMDANINDIYFERLIKFFVDYGKGQLIFTTHNTAPMNVLKRVKHGIDFITSDSGIVSWTSNGNYDPQSQYRKGMLIGLPFNVDGFDFLNCFNV